MGDANHTQLNGSLSSVIGPIILTPESLLIIVGHACHTGLVTDRKHPLWKIWSQKLARRLVVDTERKDSVTENGVKVRTMDRAGLSVPQQTSRRMIDDWYFQNRLRL